MFYTLGRPAVCFATLQLSFTAFSVVFLHRPVNNLGPDVGPVLPL